MKQVLVASLLAFALGLGQAAAAPAETCAKVGTDDTVRPYDSTLRAGFVRAFETLFPGGEKGPDDALLKAQGSYRCMDGKLLACFTGANLPCEKIDTRRDLPSVATYCRDNPNVDFVPMVVTGHDTEFAFRCKAGRSEVVKPLFNVDRQGFGVPFWAPMD